MKLRTQMVVACGLLLLLIPRVSADLGPPLIDAFWRPWNLGMLVLNFFLNALVYAFLSEQIEHRFVRVNRRFIATIAVLTIVGFALDSLFILAGHEVSAGGYQIGSVGKVIDDPRLIVLTGVFIACLATANFFILKHGLQLPKVNTFKIAAAMALILNPLMYYLISSITHIMAYVVYAFSPILSLVILFILVVTFYVLQGTGRARRLPDRRIHQYRFLALLLAISFVIAAMVGYGYGGWRPTMNVMASGFSHLKPQLWETNVYSDGRLQIPLSNGAGTAITIVSANASEEGSDGGTCTLTLHSKATPNPIPVGAKAELQGTHCHTLDPRDTFHFNITIHYTYTFEGITSQHTETGTIRGPVE